MRLSVNLSTIRQLLLTGPEEAAVHSYLFFLIAFLGGALSFFSPCTLPLLPLFLCYISGVHLERLKANEQSQRHVFYHTLFFVMGLVIVYCLMGSIVGFFGAKLFVKLKYLFLRMSGLLIILLGLYTLHLLKIPFIARERKIELKFKRLNYFTSFIQGITFSLLWSPCTGPVVMSILILAESSASVVHSTMIMFFFTLGLSVPIVLTGLLTTRAVSLIRRESKYFKIVNHLTGVLLLVIGVLLLTKNFDIVTRAFGQLIDILTNVAK